MKRSRFKQIWVREEDARLLKREAAEKGMSLCDLVGNKAKNKEKERGKFDFGF